MTDPRAKFVEISETKIDRVQAQTFKCPKNLDPNFIDGYYGDEIYVTTTLQINYCDEVAEPEKFSNCMDT